jgi:hypothetical protein
MEIGGIHIYPIKSTRGIDLAEAAVTRRGLAADRRFLVVDEVGGFLTARVVPTLCLVRTALTADGVHLSLPSGEGLAIPWPSRPAGPPLEVRIWRDRCLAWPVGEAADALLSRYLGRAARLVYLPEETVRAVDPTYGAPGDEVSFADAYPILVVTEGSLADLSARVGRPLSMRRFRPNVVIRGAAAYAEDTWQRIRIGEVELVLAKPCSRCVFTTLDPDTAAADPAGEPLRTLAGYRRGADGGVYFAQNAIPRRLGTLRLGAPVTVLA